MLTQEREKQIRELVADRGDLASQQLLAEIDRLRDRLITSESWAHSYRRERDNIAEKLTIAMEALGIVTMHDPCEYEDKDCAVFITVAFANAKEALLKIRGSNADT